VKRSFPYLGALSALLERFARLADADRHASSAGPRGPDASCGFWPLSA
jgi:hypothetical protein